jgi:MFS family permease
MGQVFSALLGYALFQIPPEPWPTAWEQESLAWALFGWGVMTVATAGVKLPFIAATAEFCGVAGVSLSAGVAEAPTYPASSRVVSTWFGPTEQGRATSIFSVWMALGSALAPPMVARLMLAWGWEIAVHCLASCFSHGLVLERERRRWIAEGETGGPGHQGFHRGISRPQCLAAGIELLSQQLRFLRVRFLVLPLSSRGATFRHRQE